MKNKTKIIYLILIGLILIFIDQLFKFIVVNYLPQDGFFVLNNNFGIASFQNLGVAFGLPMPKVIMYIVIFLILYFLLQKFQQELKKMNFIVLFSLMLVIAGAFSNLIDRVFRGFVVDYIHLFNLSVLNLADLYIISGIIIMIVLEFKKARK
ncbi:MAG: signal peptidase II [Patescibacteria group bacterium]|jgi:signal peptidase II